MSVVLPDDLIEELKIDIDERIQEIDGGNCFLIAFRNLLDHPNAMLCHGLPLGTGEDNKGQRFWHAWIEIDDWVLDTSNGKRYDGPSIIFYLVGRLDGAYKYTYDEALLYLSDVGTYGPWVEGYEEMGL